MSMQPADLLVTDARLAGPGWGWMPRHGWLAVRAGRIAALGLGGEDAPGALRILDARGATLLPGLRNAHTHGSEILLRGMADGLVLEDWLGAIWSRLDALSPDGMAAAIRLQALLSLRSGTTALVDHLRRTPMTDAVLEAASTAYAETGMRVLIAVMLRDGARADGRLIGAGHLTTVETPKDQLVRIAAASRHLSSQRIGFALGPSASGRCSDAMLDGIAALSGSADLPIHVHVAETAREVAEEVERFGMGPYARLAARGVLGPRTACAHCVHASDADVALLAETGAVVVHNPVSNLRLGSGIADVPRFRRAGIPVALGTDGSASNDGADLWESLKFAALLPRRAGLDGTDLSASVWLDMAVSAGASALSPGGSDVQALTVGAPADFCVYPPIEAPLLEDESFPAALLLSGPRRPSHVVVDGELLLENGEFTRLDEARIIADARQAALEVMS